MTISPEIRESMTPAAEYLREDLRTPEALLESSADHPPVEPIPVEQFISPEWHQREIDKLWKRCWQMACRENDIPQPGDYTEYTIADQTLVIVRQQDGSIKALRNTCLHRGTALIEGSGTGTELQCTFHGWTWKLDGTLKHVPCRWDFPRVTDGQYALPELRVGTWNGYVFINFDPACEPLEEFIGPTLARHFENWPLQRRWKAVHVVKKIRCNWKVAMQAFMEDYHIFRTHAQMVGYTGDCNSQYDVFDGKHSRMLTTMGVASPHLQDAYSAQDTVDTMIEDLIADVGRDASVKVEPPRIPDGSTSRRVLAEFMRESMGGRAGVDYSEKSDSEMLDVIQYQVFPNLMPWAGCSFPLSYRFRPAETPDFCWFDVMILATLPDGVGMPRDVPPTVVPADEPFAAAEQLGALGPVYDQDMVNIPRVQIGLHNDSFTHVTLAGYQEGNIRHFHRRLEEFLDR